MQAIYGGFSYVGLARRCNQDGIFIQGKNDLCFGVVCDGVGSLSHGELASIETTLALRNWFFALEGNSFETQCASLCDEINLVHNCIASNHNSNTLQTGTTVSAILIKDNQYFIAHIGDSRIYKVSQDMHQLTQDHSTVQPKIKDGVISSKKLLLQCVGLRQKLNVFCLNGSIKKGDAFLFCSDGFYNKMPVYDVCRLVKIIKKTTDVNQICAELIAKVLRQDEQDNVSVGIIRLL